MIASRGNRLPPDIRARLAESPHDDVRRATDNDGRVPLEPAWWLYRSTPSPAARTWSIAAVALAVLTVAGVAGFAIAQRDNDSPTTTPTPAGPVATAGDDAELQTFNFEVDGPDDATCIVFVTVTEIADYTLVAPDRTTYPAAGFVSVTGPPGNWTIEYFAPPPTFIDPTIEVDSCA